MSYTMTEQDYEDARKEKELEEYRKNKPKGGYSKDNTPDPGPGKDRHGKDRTATLEEDRARNKSKPTKPEKDKNKTTASDVAETGAEIAGQMAAAHRKSWSGYSGGSTGVVDSSKNMIAARGKSDVLTAAERKRLEQLTGGYGSSTIA